MNNKFYLIIIVPETPLAVNRHSYWQGIVPLVGTVNRHSYWQGIVPLVGTVNRH